MARIRAFVYLLLIFGLVTPQKFRMTTKNYITTTTEKNYVFEGVDYELLPPKIRNRHNNCDGEHIRCIRARNYFHPICGYDTRTLHYEDFYSPCELELYNCKVRVELKNSIFGTYYTNDRVFYNGEELNCLYYYRRARNAEEMDRLYFGKNPPYRSLPTPEKYLGGTQ